VKSQAITGVKSTTDTTRPPYNRSTPDAGSAAPPPARRPGASLHGPRVRHGGVGDETTGDGVALPGVPTAVPRRGRRTLGLVLHSVLGPWYCIP
jgi:hypothetical protein